MDNESNLSEEKLENKSNVVPEHKNNGKTDEIEELIKHLPPESQLKIERLLGKLGLRDDDYIISLLHAYGTIDTLYAKYPGALNEMNQNLKTQVDGSKKEFETVIKEALKPVGRELTVLIKEIKKERESLAEDRELFLSEQKEILNHLKNVSSIYENLISEAGKNSKVIIEQEKTHAKNLVVALINEALPKSVDKHISGLVNKANETGLKLIAKKAGQNIFIIVCAVLLSDTIKSFFVKLGFFLKLL